MCFLPQSLCYRRVAENSSRAFNCFALSPTRAEPVKWRFASNSLAAPGSRRPVQAPHDLVGRLPGSRNGAATVLESAVDRFSPTIANARKSRITQGRLRAVLQYVANDLHDRLPADVAGVVTGGVLVLADVPQSSISDSSTWSSGIKFSNPAFARSANSRARMRSRGWLCRANPASALGVHWRLCRTWQRWAPKRLLVRRTLSRQPVEPAPARRVPAAFP